MARFSGLSRAVCLDCRASEAAARSALPKAPVLPFAPLPRPPRDDVGGDAGRRSPAHLAFVRAQPCAVGAARCGTLRHAHHVRQGTDAGTGLKPADRWAVPLCPAHHAELHAGGAATFERRHGVALRALALRLAARSPFLKPAGADA